MRVFHKKKNKNVSVSNLLESGTLSDMRFVKQLTEKYVQYYWKLYTELACQRNEIQEEIKKPLIQSCRSNYRFENWQRAVKYKYSLHPLSAKGSLSYIGGRFNTGKDVNSEIPVFSGLYLAKNKDTALQEHLAQEKPKSKVKLTSREIALTSMASETIVSVSGQVDKIFDLTTSKNLLGLAKLFSDFTISKELIKLGNQLNISEPAIIKTPQLLLASLLDPHWRRAPVSYDIPANSQIFGYLIYSAGIEGILYPSKFTNQPCLAIFPRNFPETDSFVKMDDDVPHKNVPQIINAINWRICDLTYDEIYASENNRPF